jgi:hypothetical protein
VSAKLFKVLMEVTFRLGWASPNSTLPQNFLGQNLRTRDGISIDLKISCSRSTGHAVRERTPIATSMKC